MTSAADGDDSETDNCTYRDEQMAHATYGTQSSAFRAIEYAEWKTGRETDGLPDMAPHPFGNMKMCTKTSLLLRRLFDVNAIWCTLEERVKEGERD